MSQMYARNFSLRVRELNLHFHSKLLSSLECLPTSCPRPSDDFTMPLSIPRCGLLVIHLSLKCSCGSPSCLHAYPVPLPSTTDARHCADKSTAQLSLQQLDHHLPAEAAFPSSLRKLLSEFSSFDSPIIELDSLKNCHKYSLKLK